MNFEDGFTLNIERCIKDKAQPAVIRQLFTQLRDDGYINVGKYFAELSDMDLQTLTDLADYTYPHAEGLTPEQVNSGYEAMTLVGMALTVGEGGELNEKTCEDGLKMAITYTAIETLFRHGFVNVFRENWTMVDDGGQKPLVELRK